VNGAWIAIRVITGCEYPQTCRAQPMKVKLLASGNILSDWTIGCHAIRCHLYSAAGLGDRHGEM